jgi:deferrochelatase/peroxidase EfeB
MACPFKGLTDITRRNFFTAAGGVGLAVAAGTGLGFGLGPAAKLFERSPNGTEKFYGAHQAGIVTPQQSHSYFAAFNLATDKRDGVVALLKDWTTAAAQMTQGKSVNNDGGDAMGLNPSRLTVTFGFGPGLFTKDGKDRYGLAARRPAEFIDLPKFNGDQLIAEKSGGDLSVQACANDPQVAFHAIRQFARIAGDRAHIRWAQTGFLSGGNDGETPRNLMGFKDGTQQPKDHNKFVWVGNEGPDWMRGGSYLIARRIRIALEHWDSMDVAAQEDIIGRKKISGAPLTGRNEFDALDLNASDKDGNYIIPENSHIRLGNAASNNGAEILRRGYSYNDGVNFTAERWPPWRQGIEYDAGLFFISYQRDPQTFIKIFDRMAKQDALNQFTTHTNSAMFACPGGARPGEFIGQRLFS